MKEQAAALITDFSLSTGGDQTALVELTKVVKAIADNAQDVGTKDFCDHVLNEIFNWSFGYIEHRDSWLECVATAA